MADNLIPALIGAGATVSGVLLTWGLSIIEKRRASAKYRRTLGISSLTSPMGKWKCQWFRKDGTLYVEDDVTIEDWLKDGRFHGKGIQTNLSYTLEGEVDASRVITLAYRTTDFPTKAYVGVACLAFNQEGDELSGYWYGRARGGIFEGGETRWRRN